jgi:hypothetical protein
VSLAEQLEPEEGFVAGEDSDDEDELEEALPIGNAWALHLLDDESATKLACDRAWNSYLRGSREHGHERTPARRELTDAQVVAFRTPVHGRLAAERAAAKKKSEAERATTERKPRVRAPRPPAAPRKPKVTPADIVEVLRARGPLARGVLQSQVGGAALATFHRALKLAIKLGLVDRHGHGTYSLAGLAALAGPKTPPPPTAPDDGDDDPPDSEPPPSDPGGEPMPAPLPIPEPEPLAARARRPRAPRAPRVSFFDALKTALAAKLLRQLPRKGSDPYHDIPITTQGPAGSVLRFRGFVLRIPDKALADRLHKLACAESR